MYTDSVSFVGVLTWASVASEPLEKMFANFSVHVWMASSVREALQSRGRFTGLSPALAENMTCHMQVSTPG